jgi:hypothetical protein
LENCHSNLHDHMTNKAVDVPNQNPFADTLHNHLVFLLLYSDLPPQDEDLSVSFQDSTRFYSL